MTTIAYTILLLGALAGGFVSGLAGFGTALMALGIWLYVVPPSIAVPLVLICSIVAQTSTLPSLWRRFDFKLVWPFLIGGLAGVPLGTLLIAHADPQRLQIERRRAAAGVSDRTLSIPKSGRVPVRRPPGGRHGRICRRNPRRPGRAVRPASHLVGERARLGQGRTARRFPDLQLDRAECRAVPAGRQRLHHAGSAVAGIGGAARHDCSAPGLGRAAIAR